MKYMIPVVLATALLTGCSEVNQTVQDAQQAVEAGKQVVEAGKQLAQSEVAQQLQTYLQQKYEASADLRQAMFSGDGKLVAQELKNTELANFSFYKSDLLQVELTGKLTADGTFQVLSQDLSKPDAKPEVIQEFNVILDPQTGEIVVQ
ncbi:hypothetical protein [Brevibacillus dissolubilis]|uniref:hypothetical protein n=1 Tax=Brevibacillus dissolubilis TaxID=1844116 RepID=UPI001116D48E|nr:hypothetical protein [Brevibacillus dissolubilis]